MQSNPGKIFVQSLILPQVRFCAKTAPDAPFPLYATIFQISQKFDCGMVFSIWQ